MKQPLIPVHTLPDHHGLEIRVERIGPRESDIRNDVHRHDFHELFFIAKGSGWHMIDLQRHDFSGTCMHVISPGQVHQLARSSDTEGFVIMFHSEVLTGSGTEDDLRILFALGVNSPTLTLDQEQWAGSTGLIHLMEKETELDQAPSRRAVQGLLAVLLAKCAHWRSPQGTSATDEPSNDVVRRFLVDVDRDFLEERKVSAYADRYAISAGHLSELLRTRIGKSAMDVIQERLILEAKRLLLHSAMSVKEIGFALHLEDPAYFSRLFKRETGLTPGEYRIHVHELYKG